MADETQTNDAASTVDTPKGPKEVTLTINGLLEDLKNGVSREDMAKKYGVTKAAIKEAFDHPKLKGHRVIREGARKKGTGKKFKITLIDDTEGQKGTKVELAEGGEQEATSTPDAEVAQSQPQQVEETAPVASQPATADTPNW